MKKLLMMLILLMAAGFMFADVITIGSGTSYTYEPIASFYGYHRSATIYTSAEIGGSGTINSISFKAYNTNATVIPIVVYMKMTTATSLSPAQNWGTLTSGLTAVYTGSFSGTTAGAWKTITIPGGFAYTGDNLQILIESAYGGGGTSGPQWYYSTSTNRNQYIRKDNTPPTTETGTVNGNRAQLQLDISGYTVFAPTFGVSPSSVAFGNTVVSTTTAYRDVTVTNTGAGTLNITSVALGGTDAARFLLDMNSNPTPWALTAGQSKIVKVAFNPLAEVGYSAHLRFVGDVKVDHDVALTGTGFDPTWETFPKTETFDDAVFAPVGWANTATVGAVIWDRQTAGTFPTCSPYSGAGMARYNSFNSSEGNKAILATPSITLPGDNYQVTFWMYRDSGYPTDPDLVNVYYNTAQNLTGATLIGTVNRNRAVAPIVGADGWYKSTLNFPAGSGGSGRYVIFEAVSSYGNNMFVDEVTVQEQPANALPAINPSPAHLATGVLPAATLSWSPDLGGPAPDGYRLYFDMNPTPTTWVNAADPTATTYDPTPDMSYGQTYYWTVVPYKDGVDAAGCPVWSFSTLFPPAIVTTPAPADLATDVQRNPTFTWVAGVGATPTSYDVYLGTSMPGTPTANVLTATYTHPSLLLASTPYVWKVVAKNAAGEAVGSTTWSFTTGTTVVYPTSYATSTADDDIGNFTFGDINNGIADPLLNNATSVNTYTDFTAIVGHFTTETSYPISITQINQYGFYSCWAKVWIDFNQNGAFDATESVFSAGTTSILNPVTGTALIPADALAGTTRLRVVLREGGTDVSTIPTGSYSYGETEDYTAEITLFVPGDPPNAAINPVPANFAENVSRLASLNWSSGGGAPTGYKLYFGTDNPPTDIQFEKDLGTDLTWTPDDPMDFEQRYYWRIQPYNGFGDRPLVDCPVWQFDVMADPDIYPPYTQEFEGLVAPALPAGWTLENFSALSDYWMSATTNGNTNPGCVWIGWDGAAASDDWLYTAPIHLTGGVSYSVSFAYKVASTTYPENLGIYWGTAPNAASMTNELWDGLDLVNTTYVTQSNMFTVPDDGVYYIGWHHHSDADMFNTYVDDFNIRLTPTEPELNIATPLLIYPSTMIGDEFMVQLHLTNNAVGTMSGTITYPTDFSGPATFEGNDVYLDVTYTPTIKGMATGTIDITSNGGNGSVDFEANGGQSIVQIDSYAPDWMIVDANSDGYSWQFWDGGPHYADPSVGLDTHTGGVAMDDWFISPLYSVVYGDIFSFWGRSFSATSLEHFQVWVSQTGGTSIGSFTDLVFEDTAVPNGYTPYSIDLSMYEGMDIRIGLHCVTDIGWYLLIDDIAGPAFWEPPVPVNPVVATFAPDLELSWDAVAGAGYYVIYDAATPTALWPDEWNYVGTTLEYVDPTINIYTILDGATQPMRFYMITSGNGYKSQVLNTVPAQRPRRLEKK